MKKLLILLLIVGCKNSTESEVHPLVGKWNFSRKIDCNTNEIIENYDDWEKYSLSFNIYNLAIFDICKKPPACHILSAHWSATTNTINMVFENIEQIENYDYLINEDTLKYQLKSRYYLEYGDTINYYDQPSNYCFILIKENSYKTFASLE